MKQLKLCRFHDGLWGTFGALVAGNDFTWSTLERNWEDNKHDTSCILLGTYICKRVNSPKFGNTFEITGVPNRSEILIHKGNYMHDSHGCLLIATGYGWLNQQMGITGSGDAFTQFLTYLKDEQEFELEIRRI